MCFCIHEYTRCTIVPRLIQNKWLTDKASIFNCVVGLFNELFCWCCSLEWCWWACNTKVSGVFFSGGSATACFFSGRVSECDEKDARLHARRLHGRILTSSIFMRRHVLVERITAYSLHGVLKSYRLLWLFVSLLSLRCFGCLVPCIRRQCQI